MKQPLKYTLSRGRRVLFRNLAVGGERHAGARDERRDAPTDCHGRHEILQALADLWPHFLTVVHVLAALVASSHAVLYKRDSRAAVAWVGLVWLAPIVGACLYYSFGINRIRRRAVTLKGMNPFAAIALAARSSEPESAADLLPPGAEHLEPLRRFVNGIVEQPLTQGNLVEPLINGESAYRAMIESIDRAMESVTLCTYIFNRDEAGKRFLSALAGAVARKVEVRVLIDDIGARFSWPSMPRPLRRAGVRVARFMPTLVPRGLHHMNLRNHRKILVVDGRIGFTGGMNIRKGHLVRRATRRAIQDLHFRVEGPAVRHLQKAFIDDWAFSTDEILEGDRWLPSLESRGNVLARGIAEGPDEDFEKIRWTILGALSSARRSVRILTPYFLPDQTIITSLNVAALSGVEVEIILPEKNNLPLVKWASMALLWQLLKRGCRIFFSPPPFDHSKLMIVDDVWVLLGSSNWDPRSLRLNFEFNLECYDSALAAKLNRVFEAKLGASRPATLEEMDGRGLLTKLRDGTTRLLSPYL